MIYKGLKEEKEESEIMSSGVASQNIDLFFEKEKKCQTIYLIEGYLIVHYKFRNEGEFLAI